MNMILKYFIATVLMGSLFVIPTTKTGKSVQNVQKLTSEQVIDLYKST